MGIDKYGCFMQYMCIISETIVNIHTGAGHIIRISSKSWFISLIPFKKWNLYNVYIHSTQTDIFQVFISFNFDDYKWQLMKTPNSVSEGHYQSNLGSHNTWAVPQTDRLHATPHCCSNSGKRSPN